MEAIPKDVIECAILDGQMPQYGDGAEWCEEHDSCYRCARDIHDMMGEEVRRLKAERDRALAELDKALGEHENAMREHGWIRLPLDVDGEPIRIGELVDERLPFGGYAKPAPVDGLELYRNANGGYGWLVKLDAENRALISPKLLRHYHAPTVEDVLEELLREYDRDDSELTNGEIIERFAAKLRLAGDAE